MLTLTYLPWVTNETTVWSKIPAYESNTVMVVNQWLILISFLMSDKWDRTVSVHSFDHFHSPSIWWSSISHWYWFIFDGWKVNSIVCVEPFPQPMHMTVFSQLVITPSPISLKGNLAGDWTFWKRSRAWKQALTNNPQNSVVGKETSCQKAKNLPVGDHIEPNIFHCWALLI